MMRPRMTESNHGRVTIQMHCFRGNVSLPMQHQSRPQRVLLSP